MKYCKDNAVACRSIIVGRGTILCAHSIDTATRVLLVIYHWIGSKDRTTEKIDFELIHTALFIDDVNVDS